MEQQLLNSFSVGMDLVTTIFATMLMAWFVVSYRGARNSFGARNSLSARAPGGAFGGNGEPLVVKRSLSGQVVRRRGR